jgi:hypothetical protein
MARDRERTDPCPCAVCGQPRPLRPWKLGDPYCSA